MKFIKIGDQWYAVSGFALTAIDAPDPAPAEGAFFDATDLAGELDALSATDLETKAKELVTAYSDLKAAAGDGGTEAIEAATAALAPAIVGQHFQATRAEALAGLQDPEDAGGTQPNAPADPPADPDPEADPAPAADPASTDGGEGGEGDPDGGEVTLDSITNGLSGAELQTVAAAGAILVRERGGTPAEQIARFLPGQDLTPASGPAQAPTESAVFTAAANLPDVGAGEAMGVDGMSTSISRWARSAKAGRGSTVQVLGSYNMYGDSPTLLASAGANGEMVKIAGADTAEFTARRAGHHGIVAAAPDRCGPNDFRRDIPDSGDISSPLLNALQSYPAPHCTLEHYRDISLTSVQSGITVWDTTARDAYQAALDAWRADVAAGSPYDPQLFANLKAAEKMCAIAGCPPTDTVTMLPIAACLEYPTDLEFCSPEAIRAYNRALTREFIRQRTSNMLAVVEALSATVTVDANAAPFVNTETTPIQLGATAVVDYVVSTLKPQGVMLERLTEGNYSLVIPFGLSELLALDNRFAGAEQLADAFPGVNNVVTALDVATTDTIPYGAVPAMGSTTAFAGNLEPPTDWSLYLLDTDDFFEISRPDIELGAQLTPSTVKGNMVFGGFMESAAGYGKDGAHPAWKLDMSNLVYNGARPARMGLAGLLD